MNSVLTGFIRRLAGVAAVVAVATLVAPDVQAQDNPYRHIPKDTVSQQVYDGWKQYELNCARCHGEFAVGSSFAPALVMSAKDDGTVPTKQAFIQVVCAGRKDKGMPAWCELGLEMSKIEAIYAYVKGRADGKIGIGRPAVRQEASTGDAGSSGSGQAKANS